MREDERVVTLLGDIGVHSFADVFNAFPSRIYNIGIFEQATVGSAAGLSMAGMIPIVHTIAPFLIERCTEQLKDDFGYQKLGGNFVSVGASYDYAALGGTHHCPADVAILKHIPGMEIILPGTAEEFDTLFTQTYANSKPTYTRLSERLNDEGYSVQFGKAHVVQKGSRATVIAVGPALKPTLEACAELDVTILYYTTVAPFDTETLKAHAHEQIILVEPYYRGGLIFDIMDTLAPQKIALESIGVPHEFLTHYGKAADHDVHIGMTNEAIRNRITTLLS